MAAIIHCQPEYQARQATQQATAGGSVTQIPLLNNRRPGGPVKPHADSGGTLASAFDGYREPRVQHPTLRQIEPDDSVTVLAFTCYLRESTQRFRKLPGMD